MLEYSFFPLDFKLLCEEKNNDEMIVYSLGKNKIYYSYAEVYNYTKRYLSFFKSFGLKKGDTIVSVMPNSPETIICFFSSMLAGLNYAPLSYNVSSREYWNWIKLVHPKLIIKKEGIAEYDFTTLNFSCKCNGDMEWLPIDETEPSEDAVSQIYLMTSGTTGMPKAVSINSNKFWSGAKAFARYYKIEESSYCFWNYLPMSYFGGLCNLALIPLCCKGSFVISEPFSGKTILNFFDFVDKYKITALWFAPIIVKGLLKVSNLSGNSNTKKLNSVKIAFLGMAPIPLNIKEQFENVFELKIYENYALSETSFLTAEDQRNIRFREEGSVGEQMLYTSLKLVPLKGDKRVSKIFVRSPFLFDGYLNEDGKTEIELDQDGYYDSKDLGYLNQNNVLVLLGRTRDVIKRGGFLVSLSEIEYVLGSLPLIEDVAAVPKKHDYYGEVYVLCIIFKSKEDEEKQKEQLRLWMKDNFAPYKMPESICIFNDFPRTASGKIQKNKLFIKSQ